MTYHRLLIDQLKEHLGSEWEPSGQLLPLLEAISEAYAEQREADERRADARESGDGRPSDIGVIRALPDQLIHFDADGVVLDYKDGCESTLPLTVEDPVGRFFAEVIEEEAAEEFFQAIDTVLERGELVTFELTHEREDGEDGESESHHEVRAFPVGEKQVMTLIRDISERKESEQRIARLAFHDSLTGLPNRVLFQERLEMYLAMAKRHGHMVAVMFLDLDRFKQINDTLGHTAGDELLVTMTARLRESLREVDTALPPDNARVPATIARVGGDEFTVILSEVSDVQAVAKVARRILSSLSQPTVLNGSEISTTVSIGISLYPYDGGDIRTLVKNADTAMYHAKERGRNNYQLYTESMNAAAVERLFLETSLHRAIERDELQIFYQPQQDLVSGRVRGLEALLRWKHPDVGYIEPSVFIPLAEESDLVLRLGKWMINGVCEQIREWTEAGLSPCRVYVNISGHQMKVDHLVPTLGRAIRLHGIEARQLGIELTESALVANVDLSARILTEVRNMGVKISVDDFGVGYSSLSYLRRFPIGSLKIDQSFIRDITAEDDGGALAGAIVALGHSLNVDVVAEGVENETQLQFLSDCGCDFVQGYLLCPPLPPAQVTAHLDEKSSSSAKRVQRAMRTRPSWALGGIRKHQRH